MTYICITIQKELTLTALSIWFEFIAFETGTSVIPHTAMSTLP